MSLEVKLSQRLSQGLVMTPQLQQAIKLLQLSGLEVRELVEQELEQNPFLEEQTPDANASDNGELGRDQFNSEQFESNFSKGARSEPLYSDYLQNLESVSGNPLSDHLLWQLRAMDLSHSEIEAAYWIICSLDENGYLACSIQEISATTGVSDEQAASILAIVQSLDPVGIAARDLRECLLLQLDFLGLRDTKVWRVVNECLSLVETGDLKAIAKLLSTTVEEIVGCLAQMRQLNPYPGRFLGVESTQYVVPDVYVRLIDGEIQVSLNESALPKVQINPSYRTTLDMGGDKIAASFMADRWKSANWLLKTIEQRNKTLLRVTQSVMEFQRDFLTGGLAQMQPLVLRQVAQVVQLHESTVSRVTTGKYVHCSHGIFELKHFFSSALTSANGDVSSEQVKDLLRRFIAEEKAGSALSDSEISKKLKVDGINVARRTVAKYRESMNIPTASKRNSASRYR